MLHIVQYQNAQPFLCKKWLSVFIFLCYCLVGNATHIVGGEIGYECLGNDDYRFTMKMYRNCNGAAQGAFPDPANIAIYTVDDGGNYVLFDNRNVFLEENNPPEIPLPEIPCLEPPENVCVEEGSYIFNSNLPLSNGSYYVIFQRCCRNGSINNILAPGDTGITLAIELTSAAQVGCNNSPIFNDFPPTVICANEPLNFDHSATDADGDQLVYEFCAPIKGGGRAGTQGFPGDAAGCDGWRPNPACPPPFESVDFVVPTYTALEPMGGAPVVGINTLTGVISGVPNIIGQFVVGVCVKEFRDGVLLSTTQRDFQFNVEQCDPLIEPIIEADIILPDNTFVVNSCGDESVDLVNQSNIEDDIDSFFWSFDLNGTEQTFDQWSFNLMLPDTGTYEGFLYLNPGSQCGDTARVLVNYFPDANADFNVEYDTCVAGDVFFTDQSMQFNDTISERAWTFGNGTTSTEINPSVDYETLGTYQVQLRIVDENGCTDIISKTVDWFPAPELIVIEPSSYVGCPPADIFFNNLTEPIDDTYQVEWLFGDGDTSSVVSPTHLYDTTGSYSINVEITNPFGCVTKRTFPNLINVTPVPVANFGFEPEVLDNFNPTTTMIDSSLFNNSWFWDFDTESEAYIEQPSYSFRDTGLQVVTLIVSHPNGCSDTTFRIIDVVPKATYFLPNAFTPNGDGTNDVYIGKGYLDGISNFNFEVWNRWGEQIFQTDDPSEGWNGTKNNTGQLSPNGTYQCFVSFIEPRGALQEYQSFITLMR